MVGKNCGKFSFVWISLLIAALIAGLWLCGQLLSERKCFTITITEDNRSIERLSRDNKELADGNQALSYRNSELRTELKYTQEKIKGQEIQIKRQENTIKFEDAKVKRLEEESIKTKKDVDELKEGLYIAKAIIDQLAAKLEKLNGSVANLESDKKALDAKNALP
jgi:outer membrane murein-binding lipoprotein Lpp